MTPTEPIRRPPLPMEIQPSHLETATRRAPARTFAEQLSNATRFLTTPLLPLIPDPVVSAALNGSLNAVTSVASNHPQDFTQATTEPRVDSMWRLQEMNHSFSLQFLELQAAMQEENRRFAALSNILKVKHETARNTLSNIR